MKNDKIKQVIIKNTTVYIFTENPEEDTKRFVELYEDENYDGVCLGYDKPELVKYTFLGKEYPCISLWFDNEDVPDYYKQYEN